MPNLSRQRSMQLANCRKRARDKGVPYDPDLRPKDIHWPRCCPLCGTEMVRGEGTPRSISPSIDRIIPALGYRAENILVLCQACNRRKQEMTVEQLYAQADYLHELAKSRGLYGMAGPEAKLERDSKNLATSLGGKLEKIAFRGRRGAPDRMLVGPTATIFIEFKAPGCTPDPHQELVFAEMRSWGLRVEVVDSPERFEEMLRLAGLR